MTSNPCKIKENKKSENKVKKVIDSQPVSVLHFPRQQEHTIMKTAKPKMIGSINCRIATQAKSGRKTFVFDGTTLGLTKSALKAGIKVGATITASGFKYIMTSAPHDNRANGFWAAQSW